eukprot:COSAG05_NODE_7149_length_850_cov_0.820240_2_plen_98_part_01
MWIAHLETAEAKASTALADVAAALLRTQVSSSPTSEGAELSTDGRVLGATLAAGRTAVVVVWNSLAFDRTQALTLPIPAAVATKALQVTTADGTLMQS